MAMTNKPKKYRVYKYASEINLSTDAIIEFLKNKALFLQEKIIKLCRAEIEKSKSLALT